MITTLRTYDRNGNLLEFVTPFSSDQAAALALRTRPQSDFTGNLLDAHQRGRMSDKMRYWLHKLAGETPQQPQATIRLGRVLDMFQRAGRNLKRPAVEFTHGTAALRVYPAGPASKYAGGLIVCAPKSRVYLGAVTKDGGWLPSRACPADVFPALEALAANPEAVAAAHGHTTGNCCFCSRKLTDARSTTMGYGPVCAENFGLEWGTGKVGTNRHPQLALTVGRPRPNRTASLHA